MYESPQITRNNKAINLKISLILACLELMSINFYSKHSSEAGKKVSQGIVSQCMKQNHSVVLH